MAVAIVTERPPEHIQARVCLHGDGAERFPIPGADAFEGEGTVKDDFIDAPELERIADLLAQEHPSTLGHYLHIRVVYLWKREGGQTSDKLTLGKCQKLAGLARHGFDGAQVAIWLAADHWRDADANRHQIEAALFHEMTHTSTDPEGKVVLVGHDVEAFNAEIEVYGLWRHDLRRTARVVRQLALAMPAGGIDRGDAPKPDPQDD